jgi:hypothetical protein
MSAQTPWGSPSTPPNRKQTQNGAGCIGATVVILLLVGALYWLFGVNHETNYAASPTTDTATSTAPDTSTTTADTSTTDTGVIETGDCLSVDGPQPTSTGTVDVSNITKVDCGSSSAQYKVIGVEPLTTDMNSCSTDYPDATSALLDQGAYFSEVYCVVDASS